VAIGDGEGDGDGDGVGVGLGVGVGVGTTISGHTPSAVHTARYKIVSSALVGKTCGPDTKINAAIFRSKNIA